MQKLYRIVLIAVFLGCNCSFGDTFVHRKDRTTYHGYVVRKDAAGEKVAVQTAEQGELDLNLTEYDVQSNDLGRNKTIAAFSISDSISYEMVTEAFEKEILAESNKGPLFILIEIDTPGGRVDLSRRIGTAISQTTNCPTIAFITGGEYGGAYSGGVAVALACDGIFMTPNASIGAASVVASLRKGPTIDLKKIVGETVAEKTRSVWRNYLASLAQQNDRPSAIARAMEDKEIEVAEITRLGERLFIETVNKRAGDRFVKTWCKKGTLLTLPAVDAIGCGICDEIVASRRELLSSLEAAGAEVVKNTKTDEAKEEFEEIQARADKIILLLESSLKEASMIRNRARMLKVMRGVMRNINKLKRMNELYPDISLDDEKLDSALTTIEAYYMGVKSVR
ncbi:MAG: hypothetical protein ACYTFK_10010 [Planctomycetota bacterium]|jgi:ClpP class serine protease